MTAKGQFWLHRRFLSRRVDVVRVIPFDVK
jgi:hypothetical protein